MKTYTIKTYSFNELSEEAKQKALNYIRYNWHDLGQHVIDDVVNSLNALNEKICGNLCYSISIVPDIREFISINNYDKELLIELFKKKDEFPLTGVCYDCQVIEALMNDDIEQILSDIHKEGEYIYSDEGLTEMIESNGYEFLENGNILSRKLTKG